MTNMALIADGAEVIPSKDALACLLASGRPLRTKVGVDPTIDHVHAGHGFCLEQAACLQRAGHPTTLVIGSFTASVGDPSGRNAARPMLSAEEALNNADRIKDQALRILSAADTHVAYNHEWLARVPLSDFFKMLSTFTVPQMLARESFQARLGSAQPLSLPELLYPLLQGIDSVCLRAEIEIGGRDQIPNFHLTRRLQSALGMEPQIAIILPLLPGTDGAEKMSASAGNDIPLDTTPEDMYGKVMSVPDTALAGFAPFARLLDRNDPNDRWPCDTHPMMAKAELARRMITRIYGPDAALRAHADFDCRFRKRNIPDELLEVEVPVPRSERALPLFQVLVPILAKTRAEARRLVEQGAIRIDGQRIMDPLFSMPVGTVSVISRSHRAHVRVTLIGCTT